MENLTPLWLGLALAGFVLGLFVRPVVLLRIAIGLALLGGLGLLASNTLGATGLAWWFGAGIAAVAVIFGVAIIGALAGWVVRRLVHAPTQRPHQREFNSILPD